MASKATQTLLRRRTTGSSGSSSAANTLTFFHPLFGVDSCVEGVGDCWGVLCGVNPVGGVCITIGGGGGGFFFTVVVVVVSVMSSMVMVGSGEDGVGDGEGDRTIGVGVSEEGGSVLSRDTSRANGRRMFAMSSAVQDPLPSDAYSIPIIRFTWSPELE